MNGFLIDTNVLSEYNRPGGPSPQVRRWLEGTERRLQYVSVLTLGEIEKGIRLLAESKRRSQLRTWLERDLEDWFSGRILSIDRDVVARWGELVAETVRRGRPLPTLDSLLAATALAHDLTIVTRNARDFEHSGIPTLNPWDS